MIELDPKRSFAVQRAWHEVVRVKSEVRYAEQELQEVQAELAKALATLEAELVKEKK